MRVEIYTKPQCIYCEMAKATFRLQQLEYIEYKLDEDFTRDEVLAKFPGYNTFPFIVIDNNFVGGYTDLQAYMKGLENGK